MTDRIEIKVDGPLPAAGKFAILAAAEVKFGETLKAFNAEHKTELALTVRPVKPNAGAGKPRAPKVAAPDAAAEKLTTDVAAELAATDPAPAPVGTMIRSHGLHRPPIAAA